MKNVIQYYRLFNILSLDVAFGAIICSFFFAEIYEASPSLISLLTLGLTVWLIYTADRLLDVMDASGEVSSERHRFHKMNQKVFSWCLMLIAAIDCGLIFFMPVLIIKRGVLLALVVIGYILLRRKLSMFKEFLIAVLYTIGIILPLLPPLKINPVGYLPIIQFFLIAFINLIIFSWYERESDSNDKQHSIATKLDEQTLRSILFVLFFGSFTISGSLLLTTKLYFASVMLLMMTVIHLLIFWRKSWFERDNLYRLVGDASFLFPLLYVLL